MRTFFLSASLILTGLFLHTTARGQAVKPFWSEDFSSGKMPSGWKNVDVSKKGCEWIITDQPYPGSYLYQQQAPPIASTSRGYHLQYQAGWITDEDVAIWKKKGEYPDCYLMTSAINCSSHAGVLLNFEQTFRWQEQDHAPGSGLLVGVSHDGKNWKEFDVTDHAPASADMFVPRRESLDISEVAAGRDSVYIRFYWKGMYAWYWMVDDISLSEPAGTDLGLVSLRSHTESGNLFSGEDRLVLSVRNLGKNSLNNDIEVNCVLDGNKTLKAVIPASITPLKAFSETSITFPPADLAGRPSHKLLFYTHVPGDLNPANDTLRLKIAARETRLGAITAFTANRNEFEISCGISKVRVIFYNKDIFRIWATSDGEFTNPAADAIVVDYGIHSPTAGWSDKGSYYSLFTSLIELRAWKNPLRFSLIDRSNGRLLFDESGGICLGSSSYQSLIRQKNEDFYGCGMQNGYFAHRGKKILIEKGGGWDDGGRPNPAPFYMSSAGYGAFRNSFDAGVYSFMDTTVLSHNENRFDCFYFYGPSLKKILDGYTRITGRPFLMPRWALSMGDANCYNRGAKGEDSKNYKGSGKSGTTPDVISLVADEYVKNRMPRGWILPNDGYGCGYTKLDSVVRELRKRGFYTGLWTENGIEKIAKEVGEYGTRLCKLDVAWVGGGYKFALDGCRAAYNSIENNSDARGFVWSVMGWAGTQRYSTVWTGDQKGNWEYIRFHIPTVIGSGLSAQNCATGDIDGIFGGSDKTYTRDLQWKCFTPVFMSMSGWAKKDKQPYVYGEPYTSINRKYLQLKQRFTPYMYSYCHEANVSGVPVSRGMMLEFPSDPLTYGTETQYQFMNGEWLLLAPVFRDESKRDSIYLPAGKWFDYWSGDEYEGPVWLNNYPAPLEKLPLFVRSGAILPMYPAMYYDNERPADTLTLDIYPAKSSSFTLYEDDGLTRKHRQGEYAVTQFRVTSDRKKMVIGIAAAKGKYDGKYERRVYLLEIHSSVLPTAISLNGFKMDRRTDPVKLSSITSGWYFDPSDRKGLIHIKTPCLPTNVDNRVEIR